MHIKKTPISEMFIKRALIIFILNLIAFCAFSTEIELYTDRNLHNDLGIINREGLLLYDYSGIPTINLETRDTQREQPIKSGQILIGDLVHASLMMVTGLGVIAYWVEFYTSGMVRTSDDPSYLDFESAFVLADAYMAACYLVGAGLLFWQHPAAIPFGIAAGSAMIFLGAMDALYNLQHDKFRNMSPEMAVETGIILWSFTMGPTTIFRLWQARHRLDVCH